MPDRRQWQGWHHIEMRRVRLPAEGDSLGREYSGADADEDHRDDGSPFSGIIILEWNHDGPKLWSSAAIHDRTRQPGIIGGSVPSISSGTENPAACVWPPPPNEAAILPTSVPSDRERMLK